MSTGQHSFLRIFSTILILSLASISCAIYLSLCFSSSPSFLQAQTHTFTLADAAVYFILSLHEHLCFFPPPPPHLGSHLQEFDICIDLAFFTFCIFHALTFWGFADSRGTAFNQFLEIAKTWPASVSFIFSAHTSMASFTGFLHSGPLFSCPNSLRATYQEARTNPYASGPTKII